MAGCLIVLLATCGAGSLAVQRGILAPPEIALRLGPLDLNARPVWSTTCAPISACMQTDQAVVYMAWLVVRWSKTEVGLYRLVLVRYMVPPRK
jgi:hypothetical protein